MGRQIIMIDTYQSIIDWINQQEFFWLRDIRNKFGCTTSDEKEFPFNRYIKHLINILKNDGLIQCTEVRGRERQYYRIKELITIDDLHQIKKTE